MAAWHQGEVVQVPSVKNKASTPTCIAFAGASVLFGQEALDQAERNPENTIFAPQHLIGRKFSNQAVKWYKQRYGTELVEAPDGGVWFLVEHKSAQKLMTPEDVLVLFVTHLREQAEAHLKWTVYEAVVAIPSLYGTLQRKVLSEVFHRVRLNVVGFLKAPAAAGLGFFAANPRPEPDPPSGNRPRNIVVCDLGSAYFDIAVLSMDKGGTVTERAVTTEHVDNEDALVRYCKKHLKAPPANSTQLRSACELAKCELSVPTFSDAVIDVECEGAERHTAQVCVTSGAFDFLCQQDVRALLDDINYCIDDVGLKKSDIDDIVMVGGTSRTPTFRRAIQNNFHGEALCDVSRPEHAGVLGCAFYAGLLANSILDDSRSKPLKGIVKLVPLPEPTPLSLTNSRSFIRQRARAPGEPIRALATPNVAGDPERPERSSVMRFATAPAAPAPAPKEESVETAAPLVSEEDSVPLPRKLERAYLPFTARRSPGDQPGEATASPVPLFRTRTGICTNAVDSVIEEEDCAPLQQELGQAFLPFSLHCSPFSAGSKSKPSHAKYQESPDTCCWARNGSRAIWSHWTPSEAPQPG